MNIELTRLKIKPGKSERVDEWFATLNARKTECIETLEREKMFIEAIFREKIGDEEFIYWFSIQGENPEPIESSPFEIDAIHHAFGRECIEPPNPRIDLPAQVALLAPEIAKIIEK